MIRLIALILICTTLGSCSLMLSKTEVFHTNYTRFINSGFWVSPSDSYAGFQYTPIATLTVRHVCGYKKNGQYDLMSTDDLLDILVERARKLGANGLIGVKFEYYPNTQNSMPVWIANGIAVDFIGDNPAISHKFNIEKARQFLAAGHNLIVEREGITLYFDPSNLDYVPEDEFVKKYNNQGLFLIKQLVVKTDPEDNSGVVELSREGQYDFTRAVAMVKELNISLIATTKDNKNVVYFDPAIKKYLFREQFIEKYGREAFYKLCDIHSERKSGD